jgi:hypothetical protein
MLLDNIRFPTKCDVQQKGIMWQLIKCGGLTISIQLTSEVERSRLAIIRATVVNFTTVARARSGATEG